MIRVVTIDDHRLFVDGIKAILTKSGDMNLVNGYYGIVNVQEMLAADKPDIVLMDMYMPEKSGVALAKEIKTYAPEVKIMLLSMEVDKLFVSELQDIGVEAYVSKELEARQLLEMIRKVYDGEIFYQATPLIAHEWLDVMTDDFHLTDREIEVLEYIKQGKTNKEIALLTNRSVWTIMTHRRNIRNKIKLLKGTQ